MTTDAPVHVGPSIVGVGAQLDDVRQWRLIATPEGRLLERRGPDHPRELCPPGQAARAVVAPAVGDPRSPRHGEVLGLLDDHGSVLAAVPVAHLADTTLTDDPTALRQRARVADLAAGLGLTLERATPDEATAIRAARRTWLRPPHETRTRRLAWAVGLVGGAGMVMAFLAADRSNGGREPDAGFHLANLLAIALLATAAVLLHLVLRRGLHHDQPSDGDLVADPPHVMSLALGGEEIVYRVGATSRHVPGPGHAGAVTARIGPTELVLLDRHDVELLRVHGLARLGGDHAVAEAARRAGLRIAEPDAVPMLVPADPRTLAQHIGIGTQLLGLGLGLGTLVLMAPLLTVAGGAVLLAVDLGASGFATRHDAASAIYGLAGAAVLVSGIVDAVRLRRWRRRWPTGPQLSTLLDPETPRRVR